MLILRCMLAAVLLAAGFAQAQSSQPTVDTLAGNGTIRNDLYINSFFGFTYRFPTTWTVLRGPANLASGGGCAGSDCVLLMLQAQSGKGRAEIHARAVPPGTTAREVLQKAAAQEESFGMKPLGVITEFDSGGWKFYRADFRAEVSSGEVLESLVTTSAKQNVLLFSLLGDSRELMDKLASGVTVGAGPASTQP